MIEVLDCIAAHARLPLVNACTNVRSFLVCSKFYAHCAHSFNCDTDLLGSAKGFYSVLMLSEVNEKWNKKRKIFTHTHMHLISIWTERKGKKHCVWNGTKQTKWSEKIKRIHDDNTATAATAPVQ